MEDIYYNRIIELLKDRVNLSNIKHVTHTIDWRVLSNNPNAISILDKFTRSFNNSVIRL